MAAASDGTCEGALGRLEMFWGHLVDKLCCLPTWGNLDGLISDGMLRQSREVIYEPVR